MSEENQEISQEAPSKRVINVETNVSDESELAPIEEKAEAPEKEVETKAEAEDQDSETEKAEDEEKSEEKAEKDDSDEDSEDDEEKDEDEERSEKDEGKRRKRKGGFKRRIDKLSKAKAEAEAERDHWRKEAMKSNTAGDEQETEDEPLRAVDGRPDADDFESLDEFTDALVEWKLDQREEKAAVKAKAQEAKSSHEKIVDTHNERVASYRKENTDYDEAMADISDIRTSIPFEQYILNSDNGPAILFELSDNPDKLEEIVGMPYQRCQMELARIEARLVDKPSAKKDVETKPTEIKSKAPAPPSPVGKGKAVSTKDPDSMSYQEYKRWRASGGV